MSWLIFGITIALGALPDTSAAPDRTAWSISADSGVEFVFPLDHGRLHAREVLGKIAEELDINAGDSLDKLDWSIDVHSAPGRIQMGLFERLTGGVISSAVEDDRIVVRLDRQALKSRLSENGRAVENWLAGLCGGDSNQPERIYGLTFIASGGARTIPAELADPPQRAVILVHGLDDPGFMWSDLIPQLHKAGYLVGRFEYPNDGPIAEAADLLASSLREARRARIEHVDIVAHSMGGLVVRDVLTRNAHYRGDGSAAGSDHYPAIDRFIMLGTPNHGSELARLRRLTEVGEYLARAWTGRPVAASDIGDGAGEAGVDLLPGSDFLRRLNERPLASHTRHTIVAGQWRPVGTHRVNTLIQQTLSLADSAKVPQWLRGWVSQKDQRRALDMVATAIDGMGDGCVTIDSARLAGVDDFNIVSANHMSMLLQLDADGSTPAAIPIILDRLAR